MPCRICWIMSVRSSSTRFSEPDRIGKLVDNSIRRPSAGPNVNLMEPEMKIQHTSALLAALLASLSLAACQQRPADTNARRADQSAPSVAATTTPSTTAPTAVDKAVNVTDDAAITAKVKTAILAEPGLKS